eukprot:3609668-Pyramimonas_sp.AAC.1
MGEGAERLLSGTSERATPMGIVSGWGDGVTRSAYTVEGLLNRTAAQFLRAEVRYSKYKLCLGSIPEYL